MPRSPVPMRVSRHCDDSGEKQLFYLFREAGLLPSETREGLPCSQGSRGGKGGQVEGSIVFPVHFPAVSQEARPGEEGCILPSQGHPPQPHVPALPSLRSLAAFLVLAGPGMAL